MKKRSAIKTILLLLLLAFLVTTAVLRPLYTVMVVSDSMEPTLYEDDRVLILKKEFWSRPLIRGDVLVIKDPSGTNDLLIKRVIDLPGDNIWIEEGALYINMAIARERYLPVKAVYKYGPKKIRKNRIFVLGDNRNLSEDSSLWGPIKDDLIVGRVLACYWPSERFQIVKLKSSRNKKK
ncbi:MAG: signal peptidase I [Candidatus Theseobacter exili]|nr:signal peptidase I [Candidatus Theseobacter exili]